MRLQGGEEAEAGRASSSNCWRNALDASGICRKARGLLKANSMLGVLLMVDSGCRMLDAGSGQ